MGSLKIHLNQTEIEELGVWRAATMDGYWEHAASKDIQKAYLLGQLRATESIHACFGNNATRLRIKRLKKALATHSESPEKEGVEK